MIPATPAAIGSAPVEFDVDSMVAAMFGKVAAALTSERIRLRDFFRASWPIVNPRVAYIPNWHNDIMAEHLEAVHAGQIKLLDIRMPPRFGKSFHVTTAFPCWEWTEDPSERFLFASYVAKLCNRHSLDRRAIISSPWYQSRWGEFVKLAGDQNLKTEFQNEARGHMITVPYGSSATGSGGRRLIIDDPINPMEAASQVQREKAVEFTRNTLMTRLDDEHNSAIIIVAQRTDVEDVQGKIVSEKEGWTILNIPIEAKKTIYYRHPVTEELLHTYNKGEVLCPAFKSAKGVAALRLKMGRSAAAQLDQEPAHDEGLLFQRSQWKELRVCPTPLFILNTWDTAVSEEDEAAYSAGLCIVKHARGYHFCKGVVHQQMPYPELKRSIRNKAQLDSADAILIEHKSSGQQANQELALPDPNKLDAMPLPVVRFGKCKHKREDCECMDAMWSKWIRLDKVQRASLVTPLFQAGLVSYDPDMEGATELIEEFASFPRGKLKDQVDAGVHGLRYLALMDALSAPEEDSEDSETDITDGL
jgi:hypothetical protein